MTMKDDDDKDDATVNSTDAVAAVVSTTVAAAATNSIQWIKHWRTNDFWMSWTQVQFEENLNDLC